ncbi:MAG: lactate utilization protein [Angelakisella sp.]|nr:lactate utilization protein [Angelakisella sp.]
MDASLKSIMEKRVEKAIKALRANRMEAEFVESKEKLLEMIKGMVPQNAVVCSGGSMTLNQTGVYDLLMDGPYDFYYRGRTDENGEAIDVMRKAFFADWYFASSNAVTLNGELYNVDGNANRVAAITYGPKNVAVIIGWNKLVKDLDEAEARVKAFAAPSNVARLNCETGCKTTGYCINCQMPGRICCTTVIHGFQRAEGRIKVFILPENFGF